MNGVGACSTNAVQAGRPFVRTCAIVNGPRVSERFAPLPDSPRQTATCGKAVPLCTGGDRAGKPVRSQPEGDRGQASHTQSPPRRAWLQTTLSWPTFNKLGVRGPVDEAPLGQRVDNVAGLSLQRNVHGRNSFCRFEISGAGRRRCARICRRSGRRHWPARNEGSRVRFWPPRRTALPRRTPPRCSGSAHPSRLPQTCPPDKPRITLGEDYELPDTLWQDQSPSTTTTSATTSATEAPDAGRPLGGDGIPCVN
jgi:hypothetical protein